MNGWDGHTDVWTDGRTNGRTSGRTDGRTDGRTGRNMEWTDGRTNGTDGRTVEYIGRADGWVDGRTDERDGQIAVVRTNERAEVDVHPAMRTADLCKYPSERLSLRRASRATSHGAAPYNVAQPRAAV